MWQTVLTSLIVLAAAVYAFWMLTPAALRLRLARRLAASAGRAGGPLWLVRTTTALERVARRRAGGCSECSTVQAEPGRPKRLDKA